MIRIELPYHLSEFWRSGPKGIGVRDEISALLDPGGGGSAALIGRSRALEITTSVALQFLLAFADWNTDRLLETRVRSMFAALPAGPDNSLARWAAQRSLPLSMRRQRLTARQQQELLFVAKALI